MVLTWRQHLFVSFSLLYQMGDKKVRPNTGYAAIRVAFEYFLFNMKKNRNELNQWTTKSSIIHWSIQIILITQSFF